MKGEGKGKSKGKGKGDVSIEKTRLEGMVNTVGAELAKVKKEAEANEKEAHKILDGF